MNCAVASGGGRCNWADVQVVRRPQDAAPLPRSVFRWNHLRHAALSRHKKHNNRKGPLVMNRLIYIIGLVVVIIAVLSFFGLR